MTLQEAKDQAAQHFGLTGWDDKNNGIEVSRIGVALKAAELMYEAGKKEAHQYCSDLEKSLKIAAKTVEIQNESLALVIGKNATYRKSLEEIADLGSACKSADDPTMDQYDLGFKAAALRAHNLSVEALKQ